MTWINKISVIGNYTCLLKKHYKFGNKTINQCLVQTLKTRCLAKFFIKFVPFCIFPAFWHKKRWKRLFPPAFGVCSTQPLVEIYNLHLQCIFFMLEISSKFLIAIFLNSWLDGVDNFSRYLTEEEWIVFQLSCSYRRIEVLIGNQNVSNHNERHHKKGMRNKPMDRRLKMEKNKVPG